MSVEFRGDFLVSNRGITKLLQILFGVIVSSILCGNWYGGTSCFGEGRIGYVSGLNFLILIANIVFLVLNLFNIRLQKLEQFYNVLATILFLIAVILLIWFIIQYADWTFWRVITTICIILLFLLFQWDFNANRGLRDDHLPLP